MKLTLIISFIVGIVTLVVCKLAMPTDYERMRYRGQSKLRRMRIIVIVSYVISGIAGWVFVIALVIAIINKLV